MGRVNVYLIEDEPLTLVDAGPNSGTSLDELERQLQAHGYSISDIELVVLTHQHMDHLGLVGIVADRAQAAVATIDAAVDFVQNYPDSAAADDEFAIDLMLRHGIGEEVVQALRAVSQAFRGWGGRASVSRVLTDGDHIDMANRRLEVLHRPGHSPTDTVFFDRNRRIAIAADHLLKHISSNPLITRPTDSSERPQPLVTYLESLAKTREMDIACVLTGHGEPVTDHRTLIDQRFNLHRRRAEKIYGMLADGPKTAFELAQLMWGNVAVTQAYLTLSEVLGHIDILQNAGRVRETQQGEVVRFETLP